jgi:hypothetical protein
MVGGGGAYGTSKRLGEGSELLHGAATVYSSAHKKRLLT